MVFGFRWLRALQILVAVACVPLAGGAAVMVETWRRDDEAIWLLGPAAIMGAVAVLLFSIAMRIPTSFVGIDRGSGSLRIRLAPFVDVTVAAEDVLAAQVVRRGPGWGLGVRTNFREVALLTAWGDVTRFELREKVRVWFIPGIWWLRTRQVSVSVRDPYLLAAQFERREVSPEAPGPA